MSEAQRNVPSIAATARPDQGQRADPSPADRGPEGRRGTVYVAVMTTAFIVSFVGLAGLTAARLHLRGAMGALDRSQANVLAAAAVEHATAALREESDWRNAPWEFDREYPSPAVAVNGGTFAWRLVDLGSGRRRLDGIGRVGAAESVYSVELGPQASPLLKAAFLCGNELDIGGTEVLQASGAPACTNAELKNSGTVRADIEASSLNNQGSIIGTQTVPAEQRPLPDPSKVFDYYLRRGTLLDTTKFATDEDELSIRRVVLSPFSNPFGDTNPEGIYIVDCRGREFEVRESRIVGTLVVLDPNPSDRLEIRQQMNWEPAFPHYPALLVRGNARIRNGGGPLSEISTGTNFNPVGTPWKGETDTTQDDQYPAAIAGIVYASGDVLFDGAKELRLISVDGVVIAGGACRVIQTAQVAITYDPVPASTPPPGFDSVAPNAIIPGTWRRTASE